MPSPLSTLAFGGAGNVVAGMLMLAGASCAVPSHDEARRSAVSLHAIFDGRYLKMHVCLADCRDQLCSFTLPILDNDLTVIGVVRSSDTAVLLFNLTGSAQALREDRTLSGCLSADVLTIDEQELTALKSFGSIL